MEAMDEVETTDEARSVESTEATPQETGAESRALARSQVLAKLVRRYPKADEAALGRIFRAQMDALYARKKEPEFPEYTLAGDDSPIAEARRQTLEAAASANYAKAEAVLIAEMDRRAEEEERRRNPPPPPPPRPDQVVSTYGYGVDVAPDAKGLSELDGYSNPFNIRIIYHGLSQLGMRQQKAMREAAILAWTRAHDTANGQPVTSKLDPTKAGGEAILHDWDVAEAENREVTLSRRRQALAALKEARNLERHACLLNYFANSGIPEIHARAFYMGRGEWAPNTRYEVGERVNAGWRRFVCIEAGQSGTTKPGSAGDPDRVTDGGAKWQRMRAQEATEEALREASEVAGTERRSNFVALVGAPGTGKTGGAIVGLMETVLRSRAESDEESLTIEHVPGYRDSKQAPPLFREPCWIYWRAGEMARANLFGDEARERISKAIDAAVLIIDDVGAEFTTEAGSWRPLLDDVLNQRYEEGLVTIVTSNVDAANFAARVGERVADRFRQSGGMVKCGDESIRKHLKEAKRPVPPEHKPPKASGPMPIPPLPPTTGKGMDFDELRARAIRAEASNAEKEALAAGKSPLEARAIAKEVAALYDFNGIRPAEWKWLEWLL